MVKERTKQQQGRYVRNKGHSFERAVAKQLKTVFPTVKRHLESQADEAAKGIDLSNTEPFGIQCKAYKKYAPIAKIEEVKVGVPVLITKGDNKPAVAVVYLDDFIKLLKGELL